MLDQLATRGSGGWISDRTRLNVAVRTASQPRQKLSSAREL